MGLHFLGVLRIGAMLRETRLESSSRRAPGAPMRWASPSRSAGRPASGQFSRPFSLSPEAAKQSRAARGLLAVYSLGLGVPFILAALAMGPFMRASHFVKAQFARIEKTVGVLLVATGVAFLTGGFQSISLWLIETFPQFGQVG